jgi:predicted TIM-barrel fold metal-dependent hydrolase
VTARATVASDEVLTPDRYPASEAELPAFAAALGLPGYLDVHVHSLPPALQRAVWGYFDTLDDPPWPIAYRTDDPDRLEVLRSFGVVAHPALAYAHKPGVAAWCNEHTLALADTHPQVLPTFTFYPEASAPEDTEVALARGGQVAKVHLQVGRFHAADPALDAVWPQLEAAGTLVVIHASAVYGVPGGDAWCGPDELRALLDRWPELRLVVAHLGMPDHDGFLALADEAPGLLLDTAMVLTDPPYGPPPSPDAVARVRELALAGRVLFGSDFPSIPHTYDAQVRGLRQLELPVSALREVLHDAAARLLARPTSS